MEVENKLLNLRIKPMKYFINWRNVKFYYENL